MIPVRRKPGSIPRLAALLLAASFSAIVIAEDHNPEPPPVAAAGDRPIPAPAEEAPAAATPMPTPPLVAAAPVAAPEPSEEPVVTFKEAREARASGDPKAIHLLRLHLDQRPDGPHAARAHQLLGRALFEAEQPRAAAASHETARAGLKAVGDEVLYRLAEGRFHAGERKAARRAYQKLLRAHPVSPWAHRARFRLVDIAYLDGRLKIALDVLDGLLERYPEFPGRESAKLLAARCLEGLGRHRAAASRYRHLALDRGDPGVAADADQALARLKAAGVRPPPLKDSERLRWGTSLSYWKRWSEAEGFLGPLVSSLRARNAPDARLAPAHYRRAKNFYAWERYDEALREFEAALGKGLVGKSRPWIARTFERLGRQQDAARTYALFLRGYALEAKLQDMLFDEALYKESEERLIGLAAKQRWRRNRASTRWRLAWLAYRRGRLEEARAAFAAGARGGGRNGWKNRYWLARTLERLGRPEEARPHYVRLLVPARSDYYGMQAENRLADLDGAPPGEALPREQRPDLADEPMAGGGIGGGSSHGQAAYHRRPEGSVDPPPGNRKVVDILSLESFRAAPPSLPIGTERAGAVVDWSSGPAPQDPVLDQPLAPSRSADVTFDTLHRSYGKFFPGLLARAREMARLGEWWHVRRTLESLARQMEAATHGRHPREARIRSAAGGSFIDRRPTARGIWGSAIDPASMPRKLKATNRRRLSLLKRPPKHLISLLGDAFAHAGSPHYARRYLLRGRPFSRTPPEKGLRDRWMREFPRAYEDLVRRYSARYGIKPEIIWAIMRVESAYYPRAYSRANARGLMQVIPKTGNLIARHMGARGYAEASLDEPEIAIRFACWYMAELLEKFHGQEPLAFAAYNGGPHNVAYWLRRKGDLPADEFIEEMRFTQAREYAKKVLRYVRLYRRIWDARTTLYLPNTLDAEFEGNINF